jgi:hypothetical protein
MHFVTFINTLLITMNKSSLSVCDVKKRIPFDIIADDKVCEYTFTFIICKCIQNRCRTHADSISNFLTTLDLELIISVYSDVYRESLVKACTCTDPLCAKCTCSESKYDHATTASICTNCKCRLRIAHKLVVNELTRRWYDFNEKHFLENNELYDDHEDISYCLVKNFLETKDYSHSDASIEQAMDLENFLVRMVCYFYKKKKDTQNLTDREKVEFKHLFNMINFENVNFETLSLLCAQKFVDNLIDSDAKFFNNVEAVCGLVISSSKSEKLPRFMKHFGIYGVCFEDLRVDDEFDIRHGNKWYVAEVKSISHNEIIVSFCAGDTNNNEKFTKNTFSDKFAKLATKTNGIKHKVTGACFCSVCAS